MLAGERASVCLSAEGYVAVPGLLCGERQAPADVGLTVVYVVHSTYYVITCRGCSNMIGRTYQTTAKALDHIR